MGKNSFVMYSDWADMIDELNEESKSNLLTAIMHYQSGRELPEMDYGAKIVFAHMKAMFDKDRESYRETCDKRKAAGSEGGKAKANKSKQMVANAKEDVAKDARSKQDVPDNENDNDNEDVNENETDNDKALKEKGAKAPKKKKHRYGEYQHVLLTDEEKERLEGEFGVDRTSAAIKYLDEYIQMKGYKARDHNLAIRKWVFDALDRENRERARSGTTRGGVTQRSQLDDLLEQIRRDEMDDS